MKTILFAIARANAERLHSVPIVKPARIPGAPGYFFADDLSRRNFERELRGEEIPGIHNHIVILMGEKSAPMGSAVRDLIQERYGVLNPASHHVSDCDTLGRRLEDVAGEGEEFLLVEDVPARALSSMKLLSHATSATLTYQPRHTSKVITIPNRMKVFLTVRDDARLNNDLCRRSRVIFLAPFARLSDVAA